MDGYNDHYRLCDEILNKANEVTASIHYDASHLMRQYNNTISAIDTLRSDRNVTVVSNCPTLVTITNIGRSFLQNGGYESLKASESVIAKKEMAGIDLTEYNYKWRRLPHAISIAALLVAILSLIVAIRSCTISVATSTKIETTSNEMLNVIDTTKSR